MGGDEVNRSRVKYSSVTSSMRHYWNLCGISDLVIVMNKLKLVDVYRVYTPSSVMRFGL